MQPENEASLRETLSDIASRLPKYAKLSHRLVADGRMSGRRQSQILGGAGIGLPLRLVPGIGPLLYQATKILTLVGAIRYAMDQMQPETADMHLEAVGLTREQLDADFQTTTALAKRAKEVGVTHANHIVEDGAKVAGRLAGRGLRALKGWQQRNSTSNDPNESDS